MYRCELEGREREGDVIGVPNDRKIVREKYREKKVRLNQRFFISYSTAVKGVVTWYSVAALSSLNILFVYPLQAIITSCILKETVQVFSLTSPFGLLT